MSESVCISLGLILPSGLPESSTCSPPKNSLHPVGRQGRSTNTRHTPRCRTSTRLPFFSFLVFFLHFVFVLVLEQLRGSRQLGRFHVDHDAGGAGYSGLRDAFQSHCVASMLKSDIIRGVRQDF